MMHISNDVYCQSKKYNVKKYIIRAYSHREMCKYTLIKSVFTFQGNDMISCREASLRF